MTLEYFTLIFNSITPSITYRCLVFNRKVIWHTKYMCIINTFGKYMPTAMFMWSMLYKDIHLKNL